jgi:hypothetical protein
MTTAEAIPSPLAEEAEISAALKRLRKTGIFVSEEPELSQYLLKHKEVLEAINPIGEALMERFSPQCEVILELFTSRSSSDSYPVFLLRQGSYDKTLMNELRSFRAQFERSFSFSSGWLAVTTDFRSPRRRV